MHGLSVSHRAPPCFDFVFRSLSPPWRAQARRPASQHGLRPYLDFVQLFKAAGQGTGQRRLPPGLLETGRHQLELDKGENQARRVSR